MHTQGKATEADGSAAGGARVRLIATANNGRRTLVNEIVTADDDGEIVELVELDQQINCLKFTVSMRCVLLYYGENVLCKGHNVLCVKAGVFSLQISPAVRERSCNRQAVCFSPAPMYSPTDSFLQLTHVSSSSELMVMVPFV